MTVETISFTDQGGREKVILGQNESGLYLRDSRYDKDKMVIDCPKTSVSAYEKIKETIESSYGNIVVKSYHKRSLSNV